MDGFEDSDYEQCACHLHVRSVSQFCRYWHLLLHVQQGMIASLIEYPIGYDLLPLLASWL